MTQLNINGATAKPTAASAQLPVDDIELNTSGEHALIPSVAIDTLLAHRQAGLASFAQAMEHLAAARAHFVAAGSKIYRSHSFPGLVERAVSCEAWEAVVKREIDRTIWGHLMEETGMMTLMNTDQRQAWHSSLYSDSMPEVTIDNVLASFKQLHLSRESMFEEGVVSLFEKLSWDYKTNNPRRFGKKIILGNLLQQRYGGWVSASTAGCARLDDLMKAFCILDGKTIPDVRSGAGCAFQEHVSRYDMNNPLFEMPYFTIRYFKKGSGHISFTRPELAERMNDIIARHYPGALPPA